MKIAKDDKVFHVRDEARTTPIVRLRFHPTSSRLFALIYDRRIAMWDLDAKPVEPKAKNDPKKPFVAGTLHCANELGWVRSMDVSSDGQLLITGGSDRHVRAWKWDDGPSAKPLRELAAHDGWVEAVALSPDGSRLATGGADHLVKLWDAKTFAPISTLVGHKNYVRDLCWMPNGQQLISGAEDGKVIVWDAEKGTIVRTIDFGEANTGQGQIVAAGGVQSMNRSPDGRWLLVAGGKKIALYDLANGELVGLDPAFGYQTVFHPKQNVIAIGAEKVKISTFEPSKLVMSKSPKSIPGTTEIATITMGDYSHGLSFSPDGSKLVLGKNDGSVELHQLTA